MKRKFRTLILGLGLALAVPAAGAPATGPKLVAGSGRSASGVFHAGLEGAEWSLPGGTRLRLSEGAALRLFTKPQKLLLAPGERTTTYTVVLVAGRLEVDVGSGRTAVLVTTKSKLNAIVKSGRSMIAATGSSAAAAPMDGQLLVATTGTYATLSPPAAVRVEGGALERATRLTAPSVTPGRRVFVAAENAAAVGALSWQPIQGARRYRVVVKNEIGDVETDRTTSETTLDVGTLRPGRYVARVTAYDAAGLPGHPSADVNLAVVGAELPQGAFVDEAGVVRLGRGQRVRFSHADALSVSYGAGGHFRKASDAIPLFRGKATAVYFRAPGSPAVTRANLAPRGIDAKVTFGPRHAVWPGTPLTVRVRLHRADGGALPTWLEPKAEVSVGVDPVEVAFERRGDELVATVPAPETPGPWVVRVEVRDQYGLPLGRDFYEVARSAKKNRATADAGPKSGTKDERVSRR